MNLLALDIPFLSLFFGLLFVIMTALVIFFSGNIIEALVGNFRAKKDIKSSIFGLLARFTADFPGIFTEDMPVSTAKTAAETTMQALHSERAELLGKLLNHANLPRIIGLCGDPGAGKSTAQGFLADLGFKPVDDGHPLRVFAIQNLSLKPDHVYTQNGKKEFVPFFDKNGDSEVIQVRDFLGRLGNALEREFGEYIMPYLALERAGTDRVSLGSVRKTQGRFINKRGGLVIQIANPNVQPSQYAFDAFDQSTVGLVVENVGYDASFGEKASRARFNVQFLRDLLAFCENSQK